MSGSLIIKFELKSNIKNVKQLQTSQERLQFKGLSNSYKDKKDYISIIIKETFLSLKWCSSNIEHYFNYLGSFSHLIGITIIFTSGDMFLRTQK